MVPLPQWLDKARASGAGLISHRPQDPSRSSRQRDADYADIPPFLLPLSVRVRLAKDKRKTRSRPASAPYDKTKSTTSKRKRTLTMPTVLKRLAGPRTCPIVVAQYKDEYRGVGHEDELHWALVVITDQDTLSGPSFQAYAQKKRRRGGSRAHRQHPSGRSTNGALDTVFLTGENKDACAGAERSTGKGKEKETTGPEYDVQWYARHAPASLYDVCATVRTLCLGGVQVGSVRAADVDKLEEYLRSHPPVPAHDGWSSRDYVLELLELLRPFKMLRADLQGMHLRARAGERREVSVEDLLPELREVGRATQQSIFDEDFRPCVRYHS